MNNALGNELGYAFSETDKLRPPVQSTLFYNVLNSSFTTLPGIQELTYPLMLANSVLISRGLVSIPHIVDWDYGHFLNWFTDTDYPKYLKSMYRPDVVERLYNRALMHNQSEAITNDMFITAASTVLQASCLSAKRCPRFLDHRSDGLIEHWAYHSIGYCSLAKALYVMNIELNDDFNGESIPWSNEQDPTNITLLYSTSHVAKLIQNVGNITDSKSLSVEVFDYVMKICNDSEQITTADSSDIILPLTIIERLKTDDEKLTFEPHLVSTFALVIANIRSIQQKVCQTDDALPSFECE